MKLEWSNDGMRAVGPDGTRYMLQREENLHEKVTWWSAHYQEVGWRAGRFKNVPVGLDGHAKRDQQSRCRRYAEQRLRESTATPESSEEGK